MPKKKQPDFDRLKINRGRTLPSGRNVTDTTFKTKKIAVQNQIHTTGLTIKDYIKRIKTGSVRVRESTLNPLNAAIKNEGNNLSLYLSDILDIVTKNILEKESSLEKDIFRVLQTVLALTNEFQISSFVPLLTNTISCGITSLDINIKQKSLTLLDKLMKTYPNLFCNSMTILNDLKYLLRASTSVRKGKKTAKASSESSSAVSYDNYSPKWRTDILDVMSLFLRALLENNFKNMDEDDRDQQEVYWDCKSPLYLEIFAGGGLKPVDIERLDVWNFNARPNDIEDPANVQIFLSDLVELLSLIFVEEITKESSAANDNLLPIETIKNLCTLFQVLRHAGEWIKLLSNCDNDLEMSFTNDLNQTIFRRMEKFPFASRDPVFDAKPGFSKQHFSCVQLNLSVCYLYSEFFLKKGSCVSSIKPQVFQYLMSLFPMQREVKFDSIPILIKTVKIYLGLINPSTGKSKVIDVKFVSELLYYMSQAFNLKKPSETKLLFSFFVNLSLQPDHNYLTQTESLKKWYVYLLAFLKKMSESTTVEEKLLKDIRKIAARRDPVFLDILQKHDINIIKDLLQHENENIRETAVFLIYNMRNISMEMFDMCHSIILHDSSFSTRSFHMLIRLLTRRFTEPDVSAEDRVNFIQFLVNTAIDSSSIYDDKWASFDLPEFSEAYLPCRGVTAFNILPSLHWKEHEKIYEVCSKSLDQLPLNTVSLVIMRVYTDIADSTANDLPIHSAIAMLKLMRYDVQNRLYSCQKQDLTHSCLLFLSVFTTVIGFNAWYHWNVGELMKSVDFDRNFLKDMTEQLEYNSLLVKEGIVVHYLLRIMKLFVARNLIREDADKMLHIMNNFKETCEDENLVKQTLYIKLLNYFNYFAQ